MRHGGRSTHLPGCFRHVSLTLSDPPNTDTHRRSTLRPTAMRHMRSDLLPIPPAQHIPQHDSCAGAQVDGPDLQHDSQRSHTYTQSDCLDGLALCAVHSSGGVYMPSLFLPPRLTLSVPAFDAPLERLFERARSPAPPHAPRSESSQTPSSPGLRLLSKMSGRVCDHLARRESPQPGFQPKPQTFSSTQRAVDIGRAVPRHASQKKRTLASLGPLL